MHIAALLENGTERQEFLLSFFSSPSVKFTRQKTPVSLYMSSELINPLNTRPAQSFHHNRVLMRPALSASDKMAQDVVRRQLCQQLCNKNNMDWATCKVNGAQDLHIIWNSPSQSSGCHFISFKRLFIMVRCIVLSGCLFISLI